MDSQQFDWKNGLQNLLKAYVSTNPYTQQSYYQAEDAKRQQESDAWNKMIQQKQLERAQQQYDMEKARFDQEQKDRAAQNVQLTPELYNAIPENSPYKLLFKPQVNYSESTQNVPQAVRDQVANYGVNVPETIKQQNLQPQYGTANRNELLQALMTPKTETGLTPWQQEQLKLDKERNNIAWFNATKDQDETKKDPLLLSFKDLSLIAAKKNQFGQPDATQKVVLSKSYSQAIRDNINDPNKAKEYIDRYNILNGTGYTYENWKQQSQRQYNSATSTPVSNIANNKSNQQKTQTTQNKPQITPQQTMADAQALSSQVGGADKAIQLLKQRGAKDNDPLIVALNQIKLKG